MREQERINELTMDKHTLIRKHDKHEVEDVPFKTKLEELELKIRQLTTIVVEQMSEQNKLKTQVQKQDKVVKKKMEKEAKIGRKENKTSFTMIIIGTLKSGKVNNVDECAKVVDEQKPGRDLDKIKTQIKTIIYQVKSNKPGRWQKYEWNEEKFFLTEK